MKILMLVNWKIEYADAAPADKQPPDYFAKGQPYWFFKHFSNAGDWQVDVADIRSFPALERFEQHKIRFYVWQTIKVLPRLKEYDLVLSHGMQSGIVLCLFRRIFSKGKYKHVVFDIGAFNSAREEGKALKLMQFASKSLDGVIYHTKGQVSYYEKCHPWLLAKSRYIPFGTDIDYFRPAGLPENTEEPFILCVGYHKRDWDTLLGAYRLLRENWKHDRVFPALKLIGKGSLEKACEGVEVLPAVPVRKMMEEIEKAAFCVLPLQSFNYSFGQMTLLQQMLLKKAVIAADVPSLKDYVTDGTDALLYEPENSRMLAEKMEELILNEPLRRQIGTQAAKTVQNKWNERRMALEIEAFLKEILE